MAYELLQGMWFALKLPHTWILVFILLLCPVADGFFSLAAPQLMWARLWNDMWNSFSISVS